MEWIDGNVGSKTNMKYPACILKGDYARGTCISVAAAGEGQIQDSGAKMIHLGKYTPKEVKAETKEEKKPVEKKTTTKAVEKKEPAKKAETKTTAKKSTSTKSTTTKKTATKKEEK